MQKENIFNVPNCLSLYRLLTFPIILYFIYTNQEFLFSVFICVNLITDILDGLIARTFNLKTAFGAKLDSLADNGTFISAILGIFEFKYSIMKNDLWLLWIFISFFLTGLIISFLKFRKFPSLHLYSTKIAGYVQGIFLFVLFAWSYHPYLFYLAMIIGFMSHIEEIIILLISKKMLIDAKGMFWILKKKKNI